MSRKKKISIWVTAGIGTILVLLLVFALLLPRLINLEAVKAEIHRQVSRELGVEIEYQRIAISFFPYPHVAVYRSKFSLPEGVTAAAESIQVYPKILPLFSGHVQIASARVNSPEVSLKLTSKPAKEKKPSAALSVDDIRKKITSSLSRLPEFKMPELNIQIKNGRLNLFDSDRKVLELTEFNAHLQGPPESRKITVKCDSSLWESLSMNGRLDTTTLKGSVQANLTQFRPQDLAANLFPDSAFQITDALVNLNINFNTDGSGQLQAEANGSTPYLKLRHGKEELDIKNPRIKGEIQIDKNAIVLSLTELALDYPQLNLSAELAFKPKAPQISLKLEGRQVDVESTRKATLVMAVENEVIQDIFDIVRGGRVPLITMTADGNAISELGDLDNIVIKANMLEGKISVPGVELNLVDAAGDVSISQGTLNGKNLEARLGNSRGREGTLKLGLKENDNTFHLDIPVQADLAELPPLLNALIEDKDFQKELAQIKELNGTALGKLILGENTEDVNVRVEASDINLTARYRPIPYPIQITGGIFTYDENRIGLRQLSGKLGKSLFSQLAAGLDFRKEPYLEVKSGKFDINLEEMYHWVSSFEGPSGKLKNLKTVKGTVALSKINIKGPLSSPRKWQFNLSGDVENLALTSDILPEPLAIPTLKFNANPEQFSFSEFQINILDAAIKGSGVLRDYLQGRQSLDLTLQGDMSSKANRWIFDFVKLPSELNFRPHSFSNVKLAWDNSGKIVASGNLSLQNGPDITGDLLLKDDELIIKNLLIRDKESRAVIGITLRDKMLDLSFSGNLHKSTADQLLANNQILAGWIKGNIRTHIDMENPLKSAAWGDLKGKALVFPWKPNTPVKINSFALNAAKNKINLQSADLTFSGNRLHAAGNTTVSARQVWFDMDITADELDGDKLKKALDRQKQPTGKKQSAEFHLPPIQGNLKIKTKKFKYGQFVWNPLQVGIILRDKQISVNITEANLCGISTAGTLQVTHQGLGLDFKPASKNQQLNFTLPCLFGETIKVDGSYDLSGEVKAQAVRDELIESLHGNFELDARDGRVYRDLVLFRVLDFLNASEILTGHLHDLEKKGLGYKSFQVKANLQNGKLILNEMLFDGATITIAGHGDINLLDQKIDLILLVAPLKTLDRILKHIPLVGGVLETLDTIPIKVKGNLKDLKVRPLAPSAVGSVLSDAMKKTLRIPIKIIQPLHLGEDKNHKAP